MCWVYLTDAPTRETLLTPRRLLVKRKGYSGWCWRLSSTGPCLLLVSREDEVAQYGRQAEQNCALGTRQRVFPQTPLRPASSDPQNPPLDPSA